MGKVNQEILDIREELKSNGIISFLYDGDLERHYPSRQMEGWIEHEGFPKERDDDWARSKRIGDLQFAYRDLEKVFEELIVFYKQRGFKLGDWNKESKIILFNKNGGERAINYSPFKPDFLIASFYGDGHHFRLE
ncbi:hypothetical protein GOV13_03980 [Candidatus Pacearchaeota archaeon]|nr:hypothetical protein [Candidatus Pacearchaeota archaeon]